jgi:hypothetical protein
VLKRNLAINGTKRLETGWAKIRKNVVDQRKGDSDFRLPKPSFTATPSAHPTLKLATPIVDFAQENGRDWKTFNHLCHPSLATKKATPLRSPSPALPFRRLGDPPERHGRRSAGNRPNSIGSLILNRSPT